MEDYSPERELEESKQISLDIEQGMKTAYWRHLNKKISKWYESEKRERDRLNSRLIRNEKDVYERNIVLERMTLLEQFLNINRIILDENLGFIGRMAAPVQNILKKVNSFVGLKPAEKNERR